MGSLAQKMTIEMQLAAIVAVLALLLALFQEHVLIRLAMVAIFGATIAALRKGMMREVVLDDYDNLHIGRHDDFIQTPIVAPFFTRFFGKPHFFIPTRSIAKIERLPEGAEPNYPDRSTAALSRAWLLNRKHALLITLRNPAKPHLFSRETQTEVKQLLLSVTDPDRLIADVRSIQARR
jgi:hypothetical protein